MRRTSFPLVAFFNVILIHFGSSKKFFIRTGSRQSILESGLAFLVTRPYVPSFLYIQIFVNKFDLLWAVEFKIVQHASVHDVGHKYIQE